MTLESNKSVIFLPVLRSYIHYVIVMGLFLHIFLGRCPPVLCCHLVLIDAALDASSPQWVKRQNARSGITWKLEKGPDEISAVMLFLFAIPNDLFVLEDPDSANLIIKSCVFTLLLAHDCGPRHGNQRHF